jgi:hypothetical protein
MPRRGGVVGALRRIAGREQPPRPPAPPPGVAELLPDTAAAEPSAPPAPAPRGGDAGAAEVARRLEEARARLRAAVPPPGEGTHGDPPP